jgi:hypothetical protein
VRRRARAHRAGHAAWGAAGQACGGLVDLRGFALKPECGEFLRIGPEGIGGDQLRASLQIRPVDFRNLFRL